MGKSAPKSPDPNSIIKAESEANRINQFTPFGNMTYGSFDASGNFKPTAGRESVMQTLSPGQQQLMNYKDAATASMFGDIFGSYTPASTTTNPATAPLYGTSASPIANTNAVAPSYSQSYGNGTKVGLAQALAAPQTNADGSANATTSVNPNYNPTTSGGVGSFSGGSPFIDPAAEGYSFGEIKARLPQTMAASSLRDGLNSWGNPENLTSGLNNWGDANLKNGLSNFADLSKIIPGLPSISTDFSGDRQRVEDATYKRALSRFQPDLERRNRNTAQDLANQGLAIGSEAYNSEMDRMNRMENEAYTNAGYDAVREGGNAYNQLADQLLRTRGQLFGEQTGVADRMASQRGQQFAENQGTFSANNQLRQNQFAENMGVFNANNQLRNMQFGENQGMFNAGQQSRQQALAEEMGYRQGREATRNRQFNERASLLGMNQTQPSFMNVPQSNVSGIMQNDYANKMAGYQSGMNGLGSLAGIGMNLMGSGLGGKGGTSALAMNAGLGLPTVFPALAASDVRLKTDITKIDEVDGINVYRFRYKNKPEVYEGVMAHEVEHIPSAVIDINGFKHVDYSKLPIEFRQVA